MAVLMERIYNIRMYLQELLLQGNDPVNPHVVEVSQLLDKLLNQYYKLKLDLN